MKYLLAILLILLSSCKTINNEEILLRPKVIMPTCLIVNETNWSFSKDVVKEAALLWNKHAKKILFNVYPFCNEEDDYVPFSFVKSLPAWCHSFYGCTKFSVIVNKKPAFREIVILEDAPFSTIIHELGHLAGCEHFDINSFCFL